MGGVTRRLAVFLLSACLWLTGCGTGQIVLTTGFAEDEVFRIDASACTSAEVLVYLANLHDQYESAYGIGIWETPVSGGTLEDSVKQTVLARLAKIKLMNLMAENYQVRLDDTEERQIREAARDYYGRLDQAQITAMDDVDEATIERMYREYAVAEKVYVYLTADVNTEVSDDEARTITVEQISLHAYYSGEDGEQVAYTAAEREALAETAKELRERIAAGEDFELLALAYNDEAQVTIGVSRGRTEESILDACAQLGEGEVSPVIETEEGYHIYRCVSAYDREQTEQRKEEILRERRKEAFQQVYDAFEVGRESYLNEELWASLRYTGSTGAQTGDFFDIYERYVQIGRD